MARSQNGTARRHYLAACAVFRNEGPYISEWVEFHRAVGVEHFYLYNNESTDDFLTVLEPSIRDGTVSLIDFPQHPGQLDAYDHCLSTYGAESRWMAFLDLDEYLLPVTATSLHEVLRDYEDYAGVCVNWQVYGSSGRIWPAPGLTLESFTRKAPTGWSRNHQVKSIVAPKRVTRAWDPHRFVLSGHNRTVTERRAPISASSSTTVSVERLRINHYPIRSLVDFLAKRRRGRATTSKRRSILHFARLDRNDEEDACAVVWANRIRGRVIHAAVPRPPWLSVVGAYLVVRLFAIVLHLKETFTTRESGISRGPDACGVRRSRGNTHHECIEASSPLCARRVSADLADLHPVRDPRDPPRLRCPRRGHDDAQPGRP